MAKILIPTPLRPYTDKQDAVDVAGATVGELLADLTRKHSGLKAHLYNDQGKLRSFVNIYVNDEDIRYLQHEQTPVQSGAHRSLARSCSASITHIRIIPRGRRNTTWITRGRTSRTSSSLSRQESPAT